MQPSPCCTQKKDKEMDNEESTQEKKGARLYQCMECTTNKMRATITLKMMKAKNDRKRAEIYL